MPAVTKFDTYLLSLTIVGIILGCSAGLMIVFVCFDFVPSAVRSKFYYYFFLCAMATFGAGILTGIQLDTGEVGRVTDCCILKLGTAYIYYATTCIC